MFVFFNCVRFLAGRVGNSLKWISLRPGGHRTVEFQAFRCNRRDRSGSVSFMVKQLPSFDLGRAPRLAFRRARQGLQDASSPARPDRAEYCPSAYSDIVQFLLIVEVALGP
jgi:hypothetical protein